LFYVKGWNRPGIWCVPAAGGEEEQIAPENTAATQNLAVSRDGLFYTSMIHPVRGFQIRFYRFATGKSEIVARVNLTRGVGLALSPDGRRLLITVLEPLGGDLWLVENFR
jgi:sugar lactone lactonase YvrE